MKKICFACKNEKLITEFRRDRTRADGHRSTCKICDRAYHRSAYMKKYRHKIKKRDRKNYITNAALLLQYKLEHPCAICGEKEPVCLEFHHKDPKKKDFGIANMMARTWARIVEEIEKCVSLCSNCHRKVHAKKLKL